MKINLTPDKCLPGYHTPKALVADWTPLSNRQAINFRRHTGLRLTPGTCLVRKDERIFEVGDADLALCVYAHTLTFD